MDEALAGPSEKVNNFSIDRFFRHLLMWSTV